jgi:hypothetical protein
MRDGKIVSELALPRDRSDPAGRTDRIEAVAARMRELGV